MEAFFVFADSVVRRANRLLDTADGDQDGIEGALAQIEYLTGYTRDICENLPNEVTGDAQQLFDVLRNCSEGLHQLLREDENGSDYFYEMKGGTNKYGKICIPDNELGEMRCEGFTVREIAGFFGVTTRTIERRLVEYNLNHKYSDISDDDLDIAVQEILSSFVNVGYRFICGQLKSAGLYVQRARILSSLRRLDPYGVANRFFNLVTRRKYSNPGPNALWHMDGNHKLVRWGFVIHGIIDGFSRLIISLVVATNNRASTVLEAFLNGAGACGVPSRVRSDCGGENFGVARWMEHYMGPDRGSIIMGPSVHNQRIERLWRDLGRVVIKLFRSVFIHMENTGILDVSFARDMMILHLVYQQRIQEKLGQFIEFFNNHKMRTEHEKTPRQLFILGCREKGLHGFSLDQVLSADNVLPEADVDVAENFPAYIRNHASHSRDSVPVFDIISSFPNEAQLILDSIDVMADDGMYGIDTFQTAKDLVRFHFG
ncbi:uncharacterized protein LOC129602365 isoform X2 [Paramacrobiotus metropolitanus]|nr:uncharacterized protein LOC129602365 isoform X2 [Paramacrobiotus metropolitanus]